MHHAVLKGLRKKWSLILGTASPDYFNIDRFHYSYSIHFRMYKMSIGVYISIESSIDPNSGRFGYRLVPPPNFVENTGSAPV